ncbi:hypothetical protein D3C73_1523220 [compost metagenome]
MEKDQAFHHVFLRPADQLRADIAVLHLQRTRARQFDGAAYPPPFTGDSIQRILTKRAVTQQPGFAIQPGATRRFPAGL